MISAICPAVLLLVFNRPEITKRVFDAIRIAKPDRLYISCDGPRLDRLDEKDKVQEVRGIVAQVDWPCNIETLFRDTNYGCKLAVSSAINWFFEHEEEGVILEDDCLPHEDFFKYCGSLLERYRYDERIGLISGTALCDLRERKLTWGHEDYVFSRYFSVWGWASWRRVWKDYDVLIRDWPERSKDIAALSNNRRVNRINTRLFDRVHAGAIDTWDYQVGFMLWSSSRIAIVPRFNLIENIGFGPDATHTTNKNHPIASKATMHQHRLDCLLEPTHILINGAYQRFIERFAGRSLVKKILEKIGVK